MRRASFFARVFSLFLFSSVFCSGLAWSQTNDPAPVLAPLTESDRAVFSAIQSDPEPAALARNSHYYISNEHGHLGWSSILSGQPGGSLLGVGADQNYLLAGWKRPDLLLLMDFDKEVVRTHGLYRLFFLHASSPADMIALWSKKKGVNEQVKIWITEEYGDLTDKGARTCGKTCKSMMTTYRRAKKVVFYRLKNTQQQYEQLRVPCFLTDAAQYAHIVDMFQKNRVFAFRGDLTQHGLAQVSKALKQTDRTLDVIYLSNAERYFPYTTQGKNVSFFKEHFSNLPWNPSSLLLRTWATGPEMLYTYYIQSPTNFINAMAADQKMIQFSKMWPAYNKKGRRLMQDAIDKKGYSPKKWSKVPVVVLNLDKPLEDAVVVAPGFQPSLPPPAASAPISLAETGK